MFDKEKEQSNTPAYKVYSDLLKKPFDTVDELLSAEREFKKAEDEKQRKIDEKKLRATEVEEALKNLEAAKVTAREILSAANKEASDVIKAAENKYKELRKKFIEDYGSYHLSYYNNNGNETISISDLFDDFFGNSWFRF